MTTTITAFEASPDEGRGLARDMRVRWALEEVGQPYDVHFMSFAALKEPSHRELNPFGQIPTYEEGDLTLFESGAIVLHIAERYGLLLPSEADGRARAIMWIFAALNTVEPPIVEYEQTSILERDRTWHRERRPIMERAIMKRLDALSAWLVDRQWLEGSFTAGDLMMVTVLRRLEGTGILERYSNLAAYMARGTARPAYQRAFAAQFAVFEQSRQPGR